MLNPTLLLLESSPCLNQPLPQLDHISDWCTVHRLMYHAPDAVRHRTYISGRLVSHIPGLMNYWKNMWITLLKYDCNSQGSAVTLHRWGGQIYNSGVNFPEDITYPKNHSNILNGCQDLQIYCESILIWATLPQRYKLLNPWTFLYIWHQIHIRFFVKQLKLTDYIMICYFVTEDSSAMAPKQDTACCF